MRSFTLIVRNLLLRESVPILFTAFVLVFVSILATKIDFSVVILTFVAMLLQFSFVLHSSVIKKITPIKVMVDSENKTDSFSHKVIFSLSLFPLLGYVSLVFGWIVCASFVVWSLPTFVKLLFSLRNQSKFMESELDKIAKIKPLVAVHVSIGNSESAYQINQWLMVLEKLSVPVVIILREQPVFNNMYVTSLPVIYARNINHVEQVLDTGVRTVLYPANGQKNAAVLRAYKLNHFFINHGESDKAVNQSKFLMAYDKLLVSGPLAERRLLQHGLPLRPNQVVQVGRPQAELVLDRGERGAPLRTILYAPTWEGFMDSVNYSSIGSFSLKQLTELFSTNKYKVLFKPHPFTGRRFSELQQEVTRIKALCEQYGHEYIGPEESVLELMNRSDLLVSDISSVLNDYLATGKPLVLCVTDKLAEHDILTDFPSSKAAYLLNENGSEDVLDLLHTISTLDVMADQREAVRADSLGDFEQGSFARFNEVVASSVQN